MSLTAEQLQTGPVRCAWQPWKRGTPAEPVVRAWLGSELGLEPASVHLERDRHGRPRLAHMPGAHDVSWSHSGGGLLMALGQGVWVGCDLEWLRPRPRALELARRFFTPGEAAWLAALPSVQMQPTFVRLWCAKEAVLKAHGRGLAFGLHRLEFGLRADRLVLLDCDPVLGAPDEWTLSAFSPGPGYMATLAWRPR